MWTLGAGAPGLGMYSWRSCFCPGFPAERTRCGRREGTEAGPVSGYQPAGHTEDGLGCGHGRFQWTLFASHPAVNMEMVSVSVCVCVFNSLSLVLVNFFHLNT